MRYLSIFLFVALCFSCKKKDPANPPEITQLVFPQNNSECTTGRDIGPNSSMVEFRWQKALNTDTYVVSVTNMNTNITQTESTSALSKEFPLEKGAPYSWLINSKNASILEAATSQTWRFYNSGFQTTYAPFPAEIIMPAFGASIFMDSNNEVNLSWSGSDIDNDIESYELYFSTTTPPNTLLETSTATSSTVTVESGADYYWKVLTIDGEGNTSDSGIFNFRVR